MIINSPVGELQAYANKNGLCGLLWPESDVSRFETELESGPATTEVLSVFRRLKDQICEYFEGARQQFELPINPVGTEFQMSAWSALQQIPYGSTRTYSEQAAIIGRSKAVRAIGAANGKNPISIVIPCHRVIGSNGSLTGFAGGVDAKKFLLEHESHLI